MNHWAKPSDKNWVSDGYIIDTLHSKGMQIYEILFKKFAVARYCKLLYREYYHKNQRGAG
ncbi:MAG: hypothetical protein DRR19_29080 [Candidatus Parabeggiatoa sp. nov. 1]|nr:MAG: hypothetical protein DRR19_29080 [Gammaproteobacteria bacterium]